MPRLIEATLRIALPDAMDHAEYMDDLSRLLESIVTPKAEDWAVRCIDLGTIPPLVPPKPREYLVRDLGCLHSTFSLEGKWDVVCLDYAQGMALFCEESYDSFEVANTVKATMSQDTNLDDWQVWCKIEFLEDNPERTHCLYS